MWLSFQMRSSTITNLFAAVRRKTAVIHPLHDLLSPEKQTDTANVSVSGLSCSCKNDMGPDAQYGLLHRTICIEGNSRHFQQVPGRSSSTDADWFNHCVVGNKCIAGTT